MQFKQHIQHAFHKLSDPSTVSTAHFELEELIRGPHAIGDQERMTTVLYHINEEFSGNESTSMKSTLRRELIKLVAKVAEVFEESMLTQLPKLIVFF